MQLSRNPHESPGLSVERSRFSVDSSCRQSISGASYLRCRLITAILFPISVNGGPPETESLLPSWLKPLLGPDIVNRVRETLTIVFGVEPSMTSFDYIVAYKKFRASINRVVSTTFCTCSKCFSSELADVFNKRLKNEETCPVYKLLDDLDNIIGNGIVMLFITHSTNTCVSLTRPTKIGAQIHNETRRLLRKHATQKVSRPNHEGYTAADLHLDLRKKVDSEGCSSVVIGVSNGSNSIFPTTIEDPSVLNPRYLNYLLVDGRFHDRRNYYGCLTSDEKVNVYCDI